jgi:hypothetical protein
MDLNAFRNLQMNHYSAYLWKCIEHISLGFVVVAGSRVMSCADCDSHLYLYIITIPHSTSMGVYPHLAAQAVQNQDALIPASRALVPEALSLFEARWGIRGKCTF